MGGSYEVCESDILGLRLVCEIGRRNGPPVGLLLDYTLGTLVGMSLALIDRTKLGKPVGDCNGKMIGLSMGL